MIEAGAHRLLREALKLARTLGGTQREQQTNLASLYYWGHQYATLAPWETEGLPLREKAPSVRARMTKTIVDEFVSHLFGEERQPSLTVENNPKANDTLQALLLKLGFKDKLPEVGRLGALHGSLGIGFHIFEGRFDIELMQGATCTPTHGRDDRRLALERGIDFDDLLRLEEIWRTYTEDPVSAMVVETWHKRVWGLDVIEEFLPFEGPVPPNGKIQWKADLERTREHGLGFVPAVWVKNIEITDDIDGAPILGPAEFEMEDEMNYTMSQAGRGIRYNQEPTLVISGISHDERKNKIRRGDNNTIFLEPDVLYPTAQIKAELMEMSGSGSEQALKYFDKLRDTLFMVVRVVRHDPNRASGVLSGVAIRQLKEPLIGLVKQARPNYAKSLALLCEKMLRSQKIEVDSVTVSWPQVIPPTPDELVAITMTLQTLDEMELLTRKKKLALLQAHLGIDDVAEYMLELDKERMASGTQTPEDELFEDL